MRISIALKACPRGKHVGDASRWCDLHTCDFKMSDICRITNPISTGDVQARMPGSVTTGFASPRHVGKTDGCPNPCEDTLFHKDSGPERPRPGDVLGLTHALDCAVFGHVGGQIGQHVG